MAFPTSVNDQVTDSVSQANVTVQGYAPATAMGNLMIATAQALANAAHNATAAQQQANILAQAATTMCVTTILSIGSGAPATQLIETLQPAATQLKSKSAAV